MPSEYSSDVKLEIGHVLFIDIVGYSKLLINQQSEQLETLKAIIAGTEQFRKAESEGKLLRLPTGDGGALVFRTTPEAPVVCALEVAKALKGHPELRVRMGIHSGPVNEITDLNQQANIAGAGVNFAQRVMDCGDAGHILLSKHVADDLEHYPRWQPYLHPLGECEVKHGVRIGVINLYDDEVGSAAIPQKLHAVQQRRVRTKWTAIATTLILLGAIIAAFVVISKKSGRSTLTAGDKSVAVLPLENLSDEKENAYFADGIQDELLSDLSKIKDLKVISRTSVMQYKAGITRNLKEIAQQLGVSNVVEGSVRRSGDHLRVSVQLIDALTDRHLWAQNYDRTVADSVTLQGELATQIASEVGATLSPQEKARVEATPTKNSAAYDAYLRGRATSQRDRPSSEAAIRWYQEAVKLDPNFTQAWAYLACAQTLSYWTNIDASAARLAAGKEAVDRAVALDPNLPETHLALGYYRYHGDRDFAGALEEFQRAEEGLPNDVDIVIAIAVIQRRIGHWKEAIANMRRAVELDPRNIDPSLGLGTIYLAVRRYPEAIAQADHALAIEPTNDQALSIKADAFWAEGDLKAVEPLLENPGITPWYAGVQAFCERRYADAADRFQKGLETKQDDYDWLLLYLGLSQERAGNTAAARATFERLVEEDQRALQKVKPGTFQEAAFRASLSRAYAGLGDAKNAIAEGEKAIALHPAAQDPADGPTQEHSMAMIYALLGDADHAIPILRRLIGIPYFGAITPGLLRLDPTWDRIRSDPRFQELAGQKP